MERLGFSVPVLPLGVRESCEFARKAEGWGYTDAWSMESGGTDGFAVAAAVGIATEEIRIGTAIVPAYTRPPALLAMGAVTAQQACGGRFCLGIGASSPAIVERWMGLSYERPYTRVRETLEVVKAALAGDKVTYSGRTVEVDGFRLESTAAPVPIFLAALGPRMLALARDHADGVVLFLAAEEGVRIARRGIGGGEIVQRVICAPGRPYDEIRNIARRFLPPYLAVPGYNRFVAAQGFEREAEAAADAWARDRTRAGAAISDKLIEALVVAGPIEACRERLISLREAGLDTPILAPLPTRGPEEVVSALEELAPA